jgi:hypothetical protein
MIAFYDFSAKVGHSTYLGGETNFSFNFGNHNPHPTTMPVLSHVRAKINAATNTAAKDMQQRTLQQRKMQQRKMQQRTMQQRIMQAYLPWSPVVSHPLRPSTYRVKTSPNFT